MKCPSCPIAGPCIAEDPFHRFACKFAEGTESERAWLHRQVGESAPPAPPPEPPPEPEPEPARPLLPLAVARRVLAIGHGACLYATRCGCAGGGAHCHRLARVVTLHDCADCLNP